MTAKATVCRAVAGCALLLGIAAPAAAQTFSKRYDPLGQHALQSGWSIECRFDDRIVCFTNPPWTDSLNYGSVVTSLLLNNTGSQLGEHRVEWPYHSSYPGWANSSDALANGGFIVGGHNIDSIGRRRASLFLFDSLGVPIVVHAFDRPGESWIGRQAKQTSDVGFVLVGDMNPDSTAEVHAFVIKTDSLGNELWSQIFPAPFGRSYFISVDERADGGLYLGGMHWPIPNEKRTWLLALDSAMQLDWQWLSNAAFDDNNAHVTTAFNDDALVATAVGATTNSENWPTMMRFDDDGSLLWQRTYGDYQYATSFYAVKECQPDGDLIAVGTISPGNYHGMLVRTTAGGDSLWMRQYLYADSLMTDGEGGFRDVEPTPDGGFVAVGTVFYSASGNNPPQYNQDVWVVKVDSMGCLLPGCDSVMGINEHVTNYRDALRVSPNPANEQVQLNWHLPQHLAQGNAMLSVVSTSGSVVRTQVLPLQVGSATMDVRDLTSGVYYLHVVSEGKWVTGAKLVVE